MRPMQKQILKSIFEFVQFKNILSKLRNLQVTSLVTETFLKVVISRGIKFLKNIYEFAH